MEDDEMKMITLNKKKILVSILFICFVWFGYIALGLGTLLPFDDEIPDKTNPDTDILDQDEICSENEISETGALPEIILENEESITFSGLDDYFVNYRIEREKMRSQQVEILREIVENPNSAVDVRKDAQKKMLNLTEKMENELKLENLIKAKNYKDAVVLPDIIMKI
jgi:stage III sporulation protein AH